MLRNSRIDAHRDLHHLIVRGIERRKVFDEFAKAVMRYHNRNCKCVGRPCTRPLGQQFGPPSHKIIFAAQLVARCPHFGWIGHRQSYMNRSCRFWFCRRGWLSYTAHGPIRMVSCARRTHRRASTSKIPTRRQQRHRQEGERSAQKRYSDRYLCFCVP